MIDGVSLLILDKEDIKNIASNNNLEFKNKEKYHYAEYKGLKIKIGSNGTYCRINGSLHVFKNQGEHNADIFFLSDLENVIEDLFSELSINAQNAIVQNLEIGINLELSYNPDRFIDSIMKLMRHSPTQTKIGVEFNFQQYTVKIYNKSKQDKKFKDNNILRIEIRFNKMIKAYRELGRFLTLDELLTPSIWYQARRSLLELIDNLKIVDIYATIDNDNMSNQDKLFLHEWKYRDKMLVNRSKRKRMKDKFIEMSKQYGLLNIKDDIKQLAINRFNEIFKHPSLKEYCESIERKNMLHNNSLLLMVNTCRC